MPGRFTIVKAPGHPEPTSYATREEAVAGIRELFEHGLAERGEFYIAESDGHGKVLRVFGVDDELAPAASQSAN